MSRRRWTYRTDTSGSTSAFVRPQTRSIKHIVLRRGRFTRRPALDSQASLDSVSGTLHVVRAAQSLRRWGFSVWCLGGQSSVDRLEKRVSERDDGTLVTAASSEGVILFDSSQPRHSASVSSSTRRCLDWCEHSSSHRRPRDWRNTDLPRSLAERRLGTAACRHRLRPGCWPPIPP